MSLKRAASASDDFAANDTPVDAKRSRNEEPETTVSRVAVLCMEQLPRPLFTHILSFAVAGFVPAAQCAPRRPNLPIRKLRTMALVSRDWMAAARGVVQDFVKNVFQLKLLTAPSQEGVEELLEEIEQRGDELLDLRITIDEAIKPKELGHVDWEELFSKCPKLQRLDLLNVPLEHAALAQILDGATSTCHELQALVFAKRCSSTKAAKRAVDVSYSKLYEALEMWRGQGTALKQLSVPSRLDDEADAPSSQFLSAVAAFCPTLEYLDGWKSAYRVDGFVECDEKWYVSPGIWAKFCVSPAVCSSLREFNWAVAPFHDDYFQIFAALPKLNLRKLCLTVSESWSWDDFKFQEEQQQRDEADGDDDEEDDGLPEELVSAPTAETLAHLAHAMPNLEQLHVILHSNMEEPASVDADAFGDEFLIAVAESCPFLNELKLVEIDSGQEIAPISTISIDGILALSKLESLQYVLITGVEGKSLDTFAFFKHWGSNKKQRTVDVGIDQGESGRAFYDEALALLTSILEDMGESEGEDATKGTALKPKIAVKVRNLITDPDFKSKNLKGFCREFNKLRKELREKCPWLRIMIEADGVLEEDTSISAFSAIGRIVVASQGASLSVFDELNVLTSSGVSGAGASTAAAAARVRADRAEAQSSQEMSSATEDDDSDSGYGSVVETATESSASEPSNSEDESDSARRKPAKRTTKRVALAVIESEEDDEESASERGFATNDDSRQSIDDSVEVASVDSADSE